MRIARRRLRYETWWIVHLYLYLALALAFAHQIVTGVSFIGHPLTRPLWMAIWAATAGMVIVFRLLHPLLRNIRHRLRVVAVNEEAPGHLLDHLQRAPSPPRGLRRPILPMALPHPGTVVACPSVLAVSAPAPALPTGDGQGPR